MSVAFFDLDRTLIDCNSVRLWLRAERRAGRVSRLQMLKGAWVLLRYSLGAAELEQAFAAGARSLAGVPEALLAARVETWFDQEVAHRLRPGAREALAAHRRNGDRLVVATSSSPYAAEAARRTFGLDEIISTRLEVRNGVFTGEIASSAYGAAKGDRLRDWAEASGVDLARCTLYTDSYTDLAALEAVGRPVAVNPDRKLRATAQARGWEIVDWKSSSDHPDVAFKRRAETRQSA